MIKLIKENSGVVALVILAIIYAPGFFGGHSSNGLFGSTACSNITCLSGGLRLVSDAGGDFESDVVALFASNIAASSTLQVTGLLSTFAGITNTQTGTSTLKMLSTSTSKGFCLQFNATSSNTVANMTFAATTTSQLQVAPVFAYGVCL